MTEYCGFVCSDVVEKAREIRKELDDFAKYNPEEAAVVMGNVLKALGVKTPRDEFLDILFREIEKRTLTGWESDPRLMTERKKWPFSKK